MDLGLSGVPAAVAGASRGLGRAIAMELAREGARVAICSRNEAAIRDAAASIEAATGAPVVPLVADFGEPDGADRFVADAAAALGGVQIANLPLSNAARSGATAFAKTLSAEVAADGITVNCLMPGHILTDRSRSLTGAPPDAGPDHPVFAGLAEDIPAGRIGLPEEFAAAAAFLCSERASYVTGVSLQVDGGWCRSLL